MNSPANSKILAMAVSAVVVAAVIAAMVMLGPPGTRRQRNLDAVRVQNLGATAVFVNGYYQRHRQLPADWDALEKEPGYRISRQDPETRESYVYDTEGPTTYRLCADFATDSGTDAQDTNWVYSDVSWRHGKGHQCFERHVDKSKQE